MAEPVDRLEESVPPAGEAVHLPGPSFLPVIVGAGITVAIVGIVISWIVVVLGAVPMVIAIGIWIKQVREEIAELPLEH
jgi:hypothetical protein